MADSLSVFQRTECLQSMSGGKLDLLVIGGGITGVGIALDASQRGLKVGLVEKQDFAEGTSSRSTKLIHGGLRYLKQGEIKLVREVGRERAIVFQNAPHVVKPAPMLLPLYKRGTFNKWVTSIGLYLYDLLAGVARSERRKMLNKAETIRVEPSLNPRGLIGGGLYVEYMTDDARLTIEIAKTARKLGALLCSHAEAVEFLYHNEKLVGVKVRDRISGAEYEVFARKIVNAAGPWADQLRKKDGSINQKRLHLTKGVHLVVSRERFPLTNAVYFDTPDGRMIFAIPREKTAYIGTTDTDYSGEIGDPRMLAADRDYLLRAVNAMFPKAKLRPGDVISSWAGLRPLIHQEGKGPSELSRKDELFLSQSGLITIAGGKLTGYRKMAEKVVDLVTKQVSKESGTVYARCRTDRVVLSGGEVPPGKSFHQVQAERIAVGIRYGIPEEIAQQLVALYGSNAPHVFERIVQCRLQGRAEPILRGQILYSMQEEMAVSLSDFLIRRTGYLYFQPAYCREILYKAADIMGEFANWSKQEKEKQISRMQQLIAQTTLKT